MTNNHPEQVLKQVEALFSAIDLLPDELRGEALEKIHLKLGVQSKQEIQAPETKTKRPIRKASTKSLDLDEDLQEKTPISSRALRNKSDSNKEEKQDNVTETKPNLRKAAGTSSKVAPTLPPTIRATDDKVKNRTGRRKKADVEVDADVEGNKPVIAVKKTRSASCNAIQKSVEIKAADPEIKKSKRKTKIPQKILLDAVTDDSQSDKREASRAPESLCIPEDDASSNTDSNNIFKLKVYRVPTGLRPNDLSDHVKEEEIITSDADPKRVKGTRTIYGCIMCDKKFSARSLVHVHMRIHTGEKPHVCHVCQKAFTQLGALNQHIKRHEGVKNISCPHCDYKSLGKIDMARHLARHTGEKNYFCEICAKRFVTCPSLKDHIKHVHERANTYICQICAFVTHRPDNLRRHIDIRHSNKEYVQCPVCNEVIKQRSSFITHMRAHTGERPHSCKKCGKKFKNHSQVAAHMRSHVDGTFVCDECKRCFKTRFHLRRHMVVHTGEKPFSCSYCSYSCNVKGNINKHVKKVHGIKDFSFKTVEGPKKVLDDIFDKPEIEQLKEKGEAMAQEFLTKLSMRKDEQLTVEALQEALEEKKRKRKEQLEEEETSGAKQKRKKKSPRAPNKRKATTLKLEDFIACSEEEICSNDVTVLQVNVEKGEYCTSSEIVPELQIDVTEEEVEEIIEDQMEAMEAVANLEENMIPDATTTIIIPPDGFICVQQSDYAIRNVDGTAIPFSMLTSDCDNGEPGAVFLIQCDPSNDELVDD